MLHRVIDCVDVGMRVGKVMLWMTENQANGEDGAKWFIKNMPEVWTKWVPADVANKVKGAL